MPNDSDSPLFVTRPELPPLEDLQPLLEEIWHSRILSNAGPIHQRFEKALGDHLGVPFVSLVDNATSGLVLALLAGGDEARDSVRAVSRRELRASERREVLTTPFTFVGTAHAILRAGLEPVFVDIDPRTFAIDPALVAASVTERTRAIMPVHCFGYGCDTERLGAIADRHGLRLVYDAAHAFGIEDDGGSILRHGDASVLSFHATKIFTTFEGGAVVSRDEEEKLTLDRLRNFGLYGEAALDIGINAKLDEFRAAIGLLQLRTVAKAIETRGTLDARYRELLAEVPGIRPIPWPAGQTRNYYSFPVLVEAPYPLSRDDLWERMHRRGVVARRYFYPLVSDMVVYRERFSDIDIPVARYVSSRILCLPLYPGLSFGEQDRVVEAMRNP